MANYRTAQKTDFSANEEKRFRQLFNQWAASVQGYDRNKLGNALKVLEVWDSPLYRGVLKTQYDNRELHNKHARFTGSMSVPQTVIRESQIDRWSLAPYPADFTSKSSVVVVPNSEHITVCPTCSGTGKVVCPKCKGTGKVERAVVTKNSCSTCGGKGYNIEYTTRTVSELVWSYTEQKNVTRYVSKRFENKKTCYHCQGRGYFEHTTYVQDPCGYCSRTGKVSCDTCGGNGKVLRTWKMHRKLYVKENAGYTFPTLLPADEAMKMSRLFDGDIPWKMVESVRVDKENFSQANLGAKPVVGDMLSKLPGSVEHSQNTAVCFSDVEVYECEARTVYYEVDNIRYVCMLVGSEWKLFTVTSPVSKRMDDLKTMVNNYCGKGQYGKAWGVLQKVNKYPQAGSQEAEMQQQLEDRMSNVTRLGANLTVVVCSIFLAPVFYMFYEHLQFFAPWSTWMMEEWEMPVEVLLFMALVFVLFFGMRSRKAKLPKFSYKAASSFSRFFRGCMVGVGNSIYYTVAALLLSYIGILQLAVGAVMLAITIVVVVVFFVFAFFDFLI